MFWKAFYCTVLEYMNRCHETLIPNKFVEITSQSNSGQLFHTAYIGSELIIRSIYTIYNYLPDIVDQLCHGYFEIYESWIIGLFNKVSSLPWFDLSS